MHERVVSASVIFVSFVILLTASSANAENGFFVGPTVGYARLGESGSLALGARGGGVFDIDDNWFVGSYLSWGYSSPTISPIETSLNIFGVGLVVRRQEDVIFDIFGGLTYNLFEATLIGEIKGTESGPGFQVGTALLFPVDDSVAIGPIVAINHFGSAQVTFCVTFELRFGDGEDEEEEELRVFDDEEEF